MSAGEGASSFRVVYPELVRQEVAELGKYLSKAKRAKFLAAVRAIDHRLGNDPEGFGEPIFDLKISGGQVRVGIIPPLTVRFAIYPGRKLVAVRWIRLLPDHLT